MGSPGKWRIVYFHYSITYRSEPNVTKGHKSEYSGEVSLPLWLSPKLYMTATELWSESCLTTKVFSDIPKST